jgi:hypothetical protein
MTEPDPFESRLEELLGDRPIESNDLTESYELIVRRARRRRVRRAVAGCVTVVAMVVAGVAVASAATHSSSGRTRVFVGDTSAPVVNPWCVPESRKQAIDLVLAEVSTSNYRVTDPVAQAKLVSGSEYKSVGGPMKFVNADDKFWIVELLPADSRGVARPFPPDPHDPEPYVWGIGEVDANSGQPFGVGTSNGIGGLDPISYKTLPDHSSECPPGSPPVAFATTTAAPRPITTSTTTPPPPVTIEHPTFAIFGQTPTLGFLGRKEWLALKIQGESYGGQLFVYTEPNCTTGSPPSSVPETPGPCGGELCIELNIVTTEPYLGRSGTGCQPIYDSLSFLPGHTPESWGTTYVEFLHDQPLLIYGIVPDQVTRVTYAGHDVPVTNNAFLLIHPAPADRSQGVPLYYYVGDCRRQAGYGAAYDEGGAEWPSPYAQVTCGTTTATTTTTTTTNAP